MAFSREQVEKVATLARLKLTDAEIELIGRQLGEVLDYVAQIQALDLQAVEPMAHCLPLQNVFRNDETGESLTADEALANAPKRSDDFYSVPAILD